MLMMMMMMMVVVVMMMMVVIGSYIAQSLHAICSMLGREVSFEA